MAEYRLGEPVQKVSDNLELLPCGKVILSVLLSLSDEAVGTQPMKDQELGADGMSPTGRLPC